VPYSTHREPRWLIALCTLIVQVSCHLKLHAGTTSSRTPQASNTTIAGSGANELGADQVPPFNEGDDREFQIITDDLISQLSNRYGLNYCQLAKQMDWSNRGPRYGRIIAAKDKSGEYYDKGQVEITLRRLNDGITNNMLLANRDLEAAYKATGAEAAEKAAAIVATLECVLLFDLDRKNSKARELLEEARALLASTSKKIDSAFKSPVGKQYAGKIVFSKAPIDPLRPNPKAFTTSFRTGDPIYAVAFFAGTVKEHLAAGESLTAGGTVDGGPLVMRITHGLVYRGLPDARPAQHDDTYWVLDLVPEANRLKSAMDPMGVVGYINYFDTLSPRHHKVSLAFGSESKNLASGEFDLDCAPGTAAYKPIAEKALSAVVATIAFPKAIKRDPKVESQIKKLHNATKVAIVDSDWTIERTRIGAITRRYVSAYYGYRGKDGNCYMGNGTFTQAYAGGGRYSKQVEEDSMNDSVPIMCDRLK
jgi:hypothetical protein